MPPVPSAAVHIWGSATIIADSVLPLCVGICLCTEFCDAVLDVHYLVVQSSRLGIESW